MADWCARHGESNDVRLTSSARPALYLAGVYSQKIGSSAIPAGIMQSINKVYRFCIYIVLFAGCNLCATAGTDKKADDISTRLALTFCENGKVNPWDETDILRKLQFKPGVSEKHDVKEHLINLTKKYPFCGLIDRESLLVLTVTGKNKMAYERYRFVFSFDSNQKLVALITHQERGPKEMIAPSE